MHCFSSYSITDTVANVALLCCTYIYSALHINMLFLSVSRLARRDRWVCFEHRLTAFTSMSPVSRCYNLGCKLIIYSDICPCHFKHPTQHPASMSRQLVRGQGGGRGAPTPCFNAMAAGAGVEDGVGGWPTPCFNAKGQGWGGVGYQHPASMPRVRVCIMSCVSLHILFTFSFKL